jgi:hypothetical protein
MELLRTALPPKPRPLMADMSCRWRIWRFGESAQEPRLAGGNARALVKCGIIPTEDGCWLGRYQAASRTTAQELTNRQQGRRVCRCRCPNFPRVPFGQDTSGENRWLPAKPPKPWDGEYPALVYGDNCPQRLHDFTAIEQSFLQQWVDGPISEDMLKLNIWTSSLTAQETGDGLLPWQRLHLRLPLSWRRTKARRWRGTIRSRSLSDVGLR